MIFISIITKKTWRVIEHTYQASTVFHNACKIPPYLGSVLKLLTYEFSLNSHFGLYMSIFNIHLQKSTKLTFLLY